MKKLLLFITVSLFTLTVQAQSITIPVHRISIASADTSLFNFQPYTLELRVIGGASIGNTNFYYNVIDSIALHSTHYTSFGNTYTRTANIEGNISIPNAAFMSVIGTDGKPVVSVFNQLLVKMDMQVDTTRAFILR